MTLTRKFKEKTKSSRVRMEMALKFGVSYYTIDRCLNLEKSDELTKPKYLVGLSEISGIPQDEIFHIK